MHICLVNLDNIQEANHQDLGLVTNSCCMGNRRPPTASHKTVSRSKAALCNTNQKYLQNFAFAFTTPALSLCMRHMPGHPTGYKLPLHEQSTNDMSVAISAAPIRWPGTSTSQQETSKFASYCTQHANACELSVLPFAYVLTMLSSRERLSPCLADSDRAFA